MISGFSTDARLFDPRLVALQDDRSVLPTYEAAPMISKTCLEKHPELRFVFQQLKGKITTEEMRRMNFLVEFEGKSAKEVASDFLDCLGEKGDITTLGLQSKKISGKIAGYCLNSPLSNQLEE